MFPGDTGFRCPCLTQLCPELSAVGVSLAETIGVPRNVGVLSTPRTHMPRVASLYLADTFPPGSQI